MLALLVPTTTRRCHAGRLRVPLSTIAAAHSRGDLVADDDGGTRGP